MTWLDGRSAGKPWYAYTSMVSPHPPNWVPIGEPWSSAYDGVVLPPINYQGDDIADLPWQTRMLLGLLGHEQNRPPAFPQGQPDMSYIDQPLQQGPGAGSNPNGRYQYYTQAAYVDYEVGRLLDYLDDHHLTESTLVIFASDHGTELFDHGINNDKHNFLDASLRVPLIMRGAGLPAGETREFATTLDITATIVAAAVRATKAHLTCCARPPTAPAVRTRCACC
jgi:arylsulfatase A-like enzyme